MALIIYRNGFSVFAKVSSNQLEHPSVSDASDINFNDAEKKMTEGNNTEWLKSGRLWRILLAGSLLFLVIVAGTIVVIWKRKRIAFPFRGREQMKDTGTEENFGQFRNTAIFGEASVPDSGEVGSIHNIGRRNSQQDSLGVVEYENGMCAIVADGMGGLADGDKISQKIVLTMMQDAGGLKGGNTEGMLYRMVSHANNEINRMLGVTGRYCSGSTLAAVLVEAGNFQWISVGDSRICLYRGGSLLQINREHVYAADLLRKAVNGEISFEEAAKDSQKKSVSSFIGMGELKYIDGSMHPVRIISGDKLLLMSDGVFNTVSEMEICQVLSENENAGEAARALEKRVLSRQNSRQDNFSAVIINIR